MIGCSKEEKEIKIKRHFAAFRCCYLYSSIHPFTNKKIQHYERHKKGKERAIELLKENEVHCKKRISDV